MIEIAIEQIGVQRIGRGTARRVSRNKRGHVAVYGIHFDTDKATIQPDSENILEQIVALLQKSTDLKLRVEGHTDTQGNAAANQALSEKLAQAAVAWLTSKGISASRLFGAAKPVADNGTDDGARRIEELSW